MQNFLGNLGKNITSNLIRPLALLFLISVVVAQVSVSNVRAAGTDLTLTKTIEGGATTAQVGDVIRYRIHFACSKLNHPLWSNGDY